MAVYYRSRI